MTNMTIEINPTDLDSLRAIMERYQHLDTALFGTNEEGEMTITSIFKDYIIVETYQNNHWVRKNIFHWDGTVEELFDGKWK